MPHRFFAVALLLALLALVGDANANMAKWWREGEFHGPLVPQDDTVALALPGDPAHDVEESRISVGGTRYVLRGEKWQPENAP